jgi:hypothetical protein
MNFKYRKEKRNLAALILSKIRSDVYDDPNIDRSAWEKTGHSADNLRSELPPYAYEQINSAVQLLKFNKHVTFFERDDPYPGQSDPLIIPTHAGIEASLMAFMKKKIKRTIWNVSNSGRDGSFR